jgi:hypothetical protein
MTSGKKVNDNETNNTDEGDESVRIWAGTNLDTSK